MNKRRFKIQINGKEFVVNVEELPREAVDQPVAQKNIVEQPMVPEVEIMPTRVRTPIMKIAPESKEDGVITAPMPGMVISIAKNVGDSVVAGEPIIVLEAMKMENEIKAPIGGAIIEVKVSPGQRVDKGETLVVIK